MKTLLQITKIELLLIARSKFTYILALVFVVLGIKLATNIRSFPFGPVGIYHTTLTWNLAFWLILIFWALAQALRKWDKQVGKMIWATVTPSWAYIWGKFLGVFCMSVLFSLLFELTAILVDQFWTIHSDTFLTQGVIYPPLGWTVFVVFWLWFVLIPVLFGVAIAIASNYLMRGGRLIGYAVILIFGAFGAKGYLPSWIDISSMRILNNDPTEELGSVIQKIRGVSPHVAIQIMDMARAAIPPYFLGWPFVINRVVFFLLPLLLLLVTIVVVDRRRTATGG